MKHSARSQKKSIFFLGPNDNTVNRKTSKGKESFDLSEIRSKSRLATSKSRFQDSNAILNSISSNVQRKGQFTKSVKVSENVTPSHTDFFEKLQTLENKTTLKEMIENSNVEQKVMSLIDETVEMFNEKNVNIQKEEAERYELIEKEIYEKLKIDNEEFKNDIGRITGEQNELIKNYQSTFGQLSYLTQSYNHQEKMKSEHLNSIYKLKDELKVIQIQNHKVNEMIKKEKIEKDNIFKALFSFTKKYNAKLPKDLKEIFGKFSNDYSKRNNDVTLQEQKKIEILNQKNEKLVKELISKNKECDRLKDIVKQSIERGNEILK